MGNLSQHFSNQDFQCNCKHCQGSLRLSMLLVGILEHIRCYYNRRIYILSGYRCNELLEERGIHRKSWHNLGKAVDIKVSEVPMKELFLFCRSIPQVMGLGLYPAGNYVHIDLRDTNELRDEWVFENGQYQPLTEEKAKLYGLFEAGKDELVEPVVANLTATEPQSHSDQ